MTIIPFLSAQGVISYLIYNSQKDAILIDPAFENAQKIVLEIKNSRLNLHYILETHTHADFFSARLLFKKLYPKAKIGLSEFSATTQKDFEIHDQMQISIPEIDVIAIYTPGHTEDSMVFRFNKGDLTAVFTGDTLLIGGTGRTDFQKGSSRGLYESLTKLLTLPDSTVIYPAHNYQNQVKTTLLSEKLTNLRLKLVSQGKLAEFIDLMDAHNPQKPDLFGESLLWNSI